MNPDDAAVVASQLGRPPRGLCAVCARCDSGAPVVIAVAPRLEDGTPFPTTFWLTCPRLVEATGTLESAGAGAEYAARAIAEPVFAAALAAADSVYREARAALAAGDDPCVGVGVAGQRDPMTVKCLHARLAAHLAGVSDPIGADVAGSVAGLLHEPCAEPRCAPPVTAG